MFCHRISSFEFQLLFSFLWRKASYHHSLKSLEVHPDLITKELKNTSFFKTVISLEVKSFVSAL